jgi:predicted amidohydrolase YtcJ
MRLYVEEDVTKLVKRRIPFRMHVSYNENITPFLDALEKVNQQTPFDGLRWSIEHAETISPENIERAKKLGGGIALDDKWHFMEMLLLRHTVRRRLCKRLSYGAW